MAGRMIVNTDHIILTDRPLIVCDIDEVVLEFLTPFERFLQTREHTLLPRSFSLHGNVVDIHTGLAAHDDIINKWEEDFFASQVAWQTPARHARETLEALSGHADIVFLTAMPPRHSLERRKLLDHFHLPYPMLAMQSPKGPVVQHLHKGRKQPVIFIDDIDHNHQSVRNHVPECLLIQMMANDHFRPLAPATTDDVVKAHDWLHAFDLIRDHLQNHS
jgi:hypothetical protein